MAKSWREGSKIDPGFVGGSLPFVPGIWKEQQAPLSEVLKSQWSHQPNRDMLWAGPSESALSGCGYSVVTPRDLDPLFGTPGE